jgi:hypothetical protein
MFRGLLASIRTDYSAYSIPGKAIDIIIHGAQYLDTFRDGRSVLDQIPASRLVQPQIGLDCSTIRTSNIRHKTLQLEVFHEDRDQLVLFIQGQTNTLQKA